MGVAGRRSPAKAPRIISHHIPAVCAGGRLAKVHYPPCLAWSSTKTLLSQLSSLHSRLSRTPVRGGPGGRCMDVRTARRISS
eukprot:85055-Pleurochrysis_carterae.AAC.1